MCGRFALSIQTKDIEKLLPEGTVNVTLKPRYNICPSQLLVSTINDDKRELNYLFWGLIPSFAKDNSMAMKMINSRAESLLEKPTYKHLIMRKRCVIYASGFYEWWGQGREKQPYYVKMRNDEPFTFAGLWDSWQSPDGSQIDTASIITTEPNELIQKIHHRMPVILPPEARFEWLKHSNQNISYLHKLLMPYNSAEMECYPISKRVNNPANDDEELILRMKNEE